MPKQDDDHAGSKELENLRAEISKLHEATAQLSAFAAESEVQLRAHEACVRIILRKLQASGILDAHAMLEKLASQEPHPVETNDIDEDEGEMSRLAVEAVVRTIKDALKPDISPWNAGEASD